MFCKYKILYKPNFILGSGLQEYAQALINIGADFGRHNFAEIFALRKKLSGTIMVDEYNKLKDQLHKDVTGQHLAITTDMWTDEYTQRSFISLSAH